MPACVPAVAAKQPAAQPAVHGHFTLPTGCHIGDDPRPAAGRKLKCHFCWAQLWVLSPACLQVALLSLLSNQQRSQLCTALKPIHVPQGTMLVAKGEVGDAFYIVESGICQVLGDANQVS